MSVFWSAIAARLPGIGLVACVVYWFLRPEASQTQNVVVISQDLGLIGEVTGYNKARGYKIFLNSSAVPYNFDQFENEALAQHNGLGYYLAQGDSVYKLPNTKELRLVRQGQRSTWHLVLPDTAMNWLTQLRAWWRGPAAPPPRVFTDPLDYALNYCLHPPPGEALALPATWQAAFPALTTAEAKAVQQQLLTLQALATDLGSRVNRELLLGAAAYDCLWAAYPQLDRGNLSTLLWQAFLGTR